MTFFFSDNFEDNLPTTYCHLSKIISNNAKVQTHQVSLSLKVLLSSWSLKYALISDHTGQCDQMARLFVPNLAIYNIENLPNNIRIAKVGSKFCQILNKSLQNRPNLWKIAKSGRTDTGLYDANRVTFSCFNNSGYVRHKVRIKPESFFFLVFVLPEYW